MLLWLHLKNVPQPKVNTNFNCRPGGMSDSDEDSCSDDSDYGYGDYNSVQPREPAPPQVIYNAYIYIYVLFINHV